MSKKKIFMIAPDFYGIDRSIASIFGSSGFDCFLKNIRTRLGLAESLSLKIANTVPVTAKILRPFLKSFLDRDNEEYLSLIRMEKPDVLFVIKGDTIYPETLSVIKKELNIPCLIYQWDCPFFSYMGHVVDIYRKSNFANGMNFYDHIFSHDPYYVDQLKQRGAKSVSYLPLATDPGQYKDLVVTDREKKDYDFDVCFVGAPIANRVEILEGLREFKIGVFGDGWDMWHKLRLKKNPDYYKGKAAGEKVAKLYKTAKIILNIHGPEAKSGLNTRTFDIPACGGFEITDYKSELDNLFSPGEDIVYYKDAADLKRLVRYYLDNPAQRRRIVENGKDRVLAEHTWNHRIKNIVSEINTKFFPVQ